MTFQKFNLNREIAVKLNDEGFKHWKQEQEKFLPEEYHYELSDYKNKANEAGYVTFQAWRFMEIFGNKAGLGDPELFQIEILVKTEELR